MSRMKGAWILLQYKPSKPYYVCRWNLSLYICQASNVQMGDPQNTCWGRLAEDCLAVTWTFLIWIMFSLSSLEILRRGHIEFYILLQKRRIIVYRSCEVSGCYRSDWKSMKIWFLVNVKITSISEFSNDEEIGFSRFEVMRISMQVTCNLMLCIKCYITCKFTWHVSRRRVNKILRLLFLWLRVKDVITLIQFSNNSIL